MFCLSVSQLIVVNFFTWLNYGLNKVDQNNDVKYSFLMLS